MRWNTIPWGTTRTVRKFLLLPVRLDGQWRWLEWAVVDQHRVDAGFGGRWRDEHWDGSEGDARRVAPAPTRDPIPQNTISSAVPPKPRVVGHLFVTVQGKR